MILIEKAEDTIKVQSELLKLIPKLNEGKKFDCEIKEHREKRSLNANNYSWQLQNQIAKVLNKSIDEIHAEMVLSYGVLETYSLKEDAFKSAVRIFDYYKVLGESYVNGVKFIHVRAGIGTHLYNTKEMSQFIDGVVQEAQNLDIETKTPNEIAELKSLWEKENG